MVNDDKTQALMTCLAAVYYCADAEACEAWGKFFAGTTAAKIGLKQTKSAKIRLRSAKQNPDKLYRLTNEKARLVRHIGR